MAAADQGGPDHYRLLGVARGASQEQIAQAWRRRARARAGSWPGRSRPASCRPSWPGSGPGKQDRRTYNSS